MIWIGEIGNEFLLQLLMNNTGRLLLCSEGGHCDLALAAMDLMRPKKAQREICAVGRIYSAALPVFACGSRRFCTENARFMWHGSGYVDKSRNTAGILRQELPELERYDAIMTKQLAMATKRSAKEWRKLAEHGDHYFGAEEALAMGLVHKILADPTADR